MPGELTSLTRFELRKTGVPPVKRELLSVVDVSGSHIHNTVQDVGATDEPLSLSADMTTPGMAFIRNQSQTASVDLGVSVGGTFYPSTRIGPRESWVGRLNPTASHRVRSTSGTALIEVLVVSN